MKEAQKIFDQLTAELESTEDKILLANDLYTVLFLLLSKELEKKNEKTSVLIDSIKAMTNSYIKKLMKLVTDTELTTTEKDEQ